MPGRPSMKLLGILLAGAALLLLVACSPSHPQSTFDVAGPIAEKQRTLFYIIFWAAVFVFILVEGVLLYAVIRYRRRWWRDAQIPPQTHGNTPLEIAWTIAPVFVLAVIAVPTIIYIFDIADSPPDALEIRVTGHQWWWEFEYPEQRLVGDLVVTANEMHVPVDTPVKLTLISDDVIHSFWVPKLAGKQDVVPQHENPMRFTARSSYIDDPLPHTIFGQCAEFCGVAHAHMRFRVIVDTPEGFQAWQQNYHEIASRAPPQGDSREARGFLQFQIRGCLLCHKNDGPATAKVRQSLADAFERGEPRFPAPNLTNFGTRSTLAAGMLENDSRGKNLERWLRNPDDVKPGNRMGRLATVYRDEGEGMNDDDIAALAAYLLSLK